MFQGAYGLIPRIYTSCGGKIQLQFCAQGRLRWGNPLLDISGAAEFPDHALEMGVAFGADLAICQAGP